jgi:hypothetical protein
MTDQTLLAAGAFQILSQAAQAETGIIVEITTPVPMIAPALRAKQVLLRFKQENSDFANIQIRMSPDDPDGELWLINNNRRGLQ